VIWKGFGRKESWSDQINIPKSVSAEEISKFSIHMWCLTQIPEYRSRASVLPQRFSQC